MQVIIDGGTLRVYCCANLGSLSMILVILTDRTKSGYNLGEGWTEDKNRRLDPESIAKVGYCPCLDVIPLNSNAHPFVIIVILLPCQSR